MVVRSIHPEVSGNASRTPRKRGPLKCRSITVVTMAGTPKSTAVFASPVTLLRTTSIGCEATANPIWLSWSISIRAWSSGVSSFGEGVTGPVVSSAMGGVPFGRVAAGPGGSAVGGPWRTS